MSPKKRKREAAFNMTHAFENEIEECIKLLQAYEHLVEHDSLDCTAIGKVSNDFWSNWSCLFRRYLATIFSIVVIFIFFYCQYSRKLKLV